MHYYSSLPLLQFAKLDQRRCIDFRLTNMISEKLLSRRIINNTRQSILLLIRQQVAAYAESLLGTMIRYDVVSSLSVLGLYLVVSARIFVSEHRCIEPLTSNISHRCLGESCVAIPRSFPQFCAALHRGGANFEQHDERSIN